MEIRPIQLPQHQLTLTPSLRLSLEVLQMPLMHLQNYLSLQMEENPILEATESTRIDGEAVLLKDATVSRDIDESFNELWRQSDGFHLPDPHEEPYQPEAPARALSLLEHLAIQLGCAIGDGPQRQLAESLSGYLDDDGYLRTPLEEIAHAQEVSLQDVEAALQLLHRLDPPGVGARSLQECLLIQLEHQAEANSLAATIVQDHFELLAKRRIRQLAAKLHVSLQEAERAFAIITRLEPKPARNFSKEATAYHTPDLIMRELDGQYHVELNDEGLPRLSLSSRYRSLLRDGATSLEAKQFIRQKIRHAVWLLKAVNRRQETLLSIGRCLLALERDYFARGIVGLKALTHEEVAKLIGCHPSTISRATAGKTIQTPYGILQLEAFFGGGIANPNDEHAHLSPRTIQAEIKNLIASEDPLKPLSDQALAEQLKAQGYPLARRTVAKYRTSMKLLPAHLRKRCF
ncbi:MAG: RNA polymerase factor sigma-54 [Candidatus Omnitrophica bacterium]|nr:RNA polymerase factor sigma-54 [Candidatus Omnitrophota bacterium]